MQKHGSSASQLLWNRLGSPSPEGCGQIDPEPCWYCGAMAGHGMLWAKWQGATFTSQNKVRAPESMHICSGCVFVTRGKPPDTMRMYSHLLEVGGEYLKLNKGDKPKMREFLRRQHLLPWIAAIADSGQKHVIPHAVVNQPGTRRPVVMFEEMLVTLPAGEPGWALVDQMTNLLTSGATKDDITRGEYSRFAYERCAEQIQSFEEAWAAKRASSWFTLAIWLAQRDEEAVQKRMAEEKSAAAAKKEKANAGKKRQGKATHHDNRGIPRVEASVPTDSGIEHAQALDNPGGANARKRTDDQQPRRVGKPDGKKPAACSVQLKLF